MLNLKDKSKGFLIVAGVVAVLVITAIIFSCFVVADIFGSGNNRDEYIVEIPEGAGSAVVAEILEDCRMIDYPFIFRVYAKLGGEPVYQKGRHKLKMSMSYGDFIEKLSTPPDADDNIKKVVIPEGYELWQIVDLLAENGLGTKERFMEEIEYGEFDYDFIDKIPERENRLEGYLYPDTYIFSLQENAHDIIGKMLDTFNQKVVPLYTQAATDRSLDEILIMASVVEREAANDEERSTVASVFYNRIKIGMRLESCATVQYILKERKEILSNSDTAIDSPYNTYKNAGLPIGPIASPGLKSIEAALYPADTDYLYFVATADGSQNLFSSSFEEHNRKIQQTQR